MTRARPHWPERAVQFGALTGAIGMVATQVAGSATTGQIVFTTVFALLFLLVMWLVARGALTPGGSDGVPRREPLRIVLVGLVIIAVVMGFGTLWGIWVAIESGLAADAWQVLAHAGITACTAGATVLVRRARIGYLARYVWPYRTDPEQEH